MGMLFPAASASPPSNVAQMRPDWVAGRGYRPHYGYTKAPAGSVNFGAPNLLIFVPAFIPNAITIASIFACGTGGSARFGLYSDIGTQPGALLVDGGLLAFGGGGAQSWPINYAASRGFYWIAGVCTNFFSGMTGSLGGTTSIFSRQNGINAKAVYLTINGISPSNPLPPLLLSTQFFGQITPVGNLPYFYLLT